MPKPDNPTGLWCFCGCPAEAHSAMGAYCLHCESCQGLSPQEPVAQESYRTLSGIEVRLGQPEREARAEREAYNLKCGISGSPSYGGWHK